MLKLHIFLIALTIVCSQGLIEKDDYKDCLDAVLVIPTDVTSIFNAIKSFDFPKGIEGVKTLVEDFNKAINVCFQMSPVTLETNWGKLIDCLRHAVMSSACIEGFKLLIKYWREKNYQGLARVFNTYHQCWFTCARY